MKKEVPASVKCNIGGKYILDEAYGAISLVRRPEKEHAFLVLEQYLEGKIQCKVAHLTYKPDTRETKAVILYKPMSNVDLTKLAEKCHSITWQISKAQIETFEALMALEVTRGEANEIDYVTFGNPKARRYFFKPSSYLIPKTSVAVSQENIIEKRQELNEKMAKCSDKTQSEFTKLMAIVKILTVSFVEMLLRDGDNCVTWAISMLESVGISGTQDHKFHPILYANPESIVVGNIDGDEEKEYSRGIRRNK